MCTHFGRKKEITGHSRLLPCTLHLFVLVDYFISVLLSHLEISYKNFGEKRGRGRGVPPAHGGDHGDRGEADRHDSMSRSSTFNEGASEGRGGAQHVVAQRQETTGQWLQPAGAPLAQIHLLNARRLRRELWSTSHVSCQQVQSHSTGTASASAMRGWTRPLCSPPPRSRLLLHHRNVSLTTSQVNDMFRDINELLPWSDPVKIKKKKKKKKFYQLLPVFELIGRNCKAHLRQSWINVFLLLLFWFLCDTYFQIPHKRSTFIWLCHEKQPFVTSQKAFLSLPTTATRCSVSPLRLIWKTNLFSWKSSIRWIKVKMNRLLVNDLIMICLLLQAIVFVF